MKKLMLMISLVAAGLSQAATEKVVITNGFRFSPELIQVRAGDSVEFINQSGGTHTVTANPDLVQDPGNIRLPQGAAPFHSGAIRPGKSFTQVFTVPGIYQYVCLPHEGMGMRGQVEVLKAPLIP